MTKIELILSNEKFVSNNNFASSIKRNFERYGSLTEKQKQAIVRCYDGFLKYQKIVAESKARNASCVFVGEINQRITTTVRLEKTHSFCGRFGETTIFTFRDENDNILKWFTSSRSESDFSKDVTYTLTATVKKHEVYQEIKSTVVTRASLSSIGLGLAA